MPETPPPFPESFDAMPRAFQKKLGRLVIDKQLEIQGGLPGMLKWAYLGTTRPDGIAVRYTASPREVWALLCADVEQAANAAPNATPTTTRSQP